MISHITPYDKRTKEEWLDILKKNVYGDPSYTEDICFPEDFIDDEEMVMAGINLSVSSLERASDRLKNDFKFILMASTHKFDLALEPNEDHFRSEIWEYASDKIKNNPDNILLLIKEAPDCYSYASKRLLHKKEFVLASIEAISKEDVSWIEYGLRHQDKSNCLLSDKDVLNAVYKKSTLAFIKMINEQKSRSNGEPEDWECIDFSAIYPSSHDSNYHMMEAKTAIEAIEKNVAEVIKRADEIYDLDKAKYLRIDSGFKDRDPLALVLAHNLECLNIDDITNVQGSNIGPFKHEIDRIFELVLSKKKELKASSKTPTITSIKDIPFIKQSREGWLKILKESVYGYPLYTEDPLFPIELNDDEEIVMAGINLSPTSFAKASDRLKNDFDFMVMAAICEHDIIIDNNDYRDDIWKYASPHITDNADSVLRLAREAPRLYGYASNRLLHDKEFIIKSINLIKREDVVWIHTHMKIQDGTNTLFTDKDILNELYMKSTRAFIELACKEKASWDDEPDYQGKINFGIIYQSNHDIIFHKREAEVTIKEIEKRIFKLRQFAERDNTPEKGRLLTIDNLTLMHNLEFLDLEDIMDVQKTNTGPFKDQINRIFDNIIEKKQILKIPQGNNGVFKKSRRSQYGA